MTGTDTGPAVATSARHRVGVGLLLLAALAAAASAVVAAGTVADAGPDTEVVETWRMVGLAFFAGLFVLLARAPRRLRGLWELTIAAKVALPLCGVTFLAGADDVGQLVVGDGLLVVALLVAYWCLQGWTATPAGATS